MATLNPYLKFNGNCREAMSFYKDILGWELNIMTVGDSPAGDSMSAPKDSIMHSSLMQGERVIMGSDLHWGEEHSNGNGLQICVNCETEEEINKFFQKLSIDGHVLQPLMDMPWGSKFASVIDKYGKYWILNYDEAPTA